MTNKNNPPFKAKVQRLLKERTKSQAMLAEYIDVSKSHLSRVLKGERQADRALLERIADFLDLAFDELVAGTEYEGEAVPGRASVERETYEQLLERLSDATSGAAVLDAELAAEKEKTGRLETQLTSALDESRAASDQSIELARDIERLTIERDEAMSHQAKLEGRVDELEAAKGAQQQRLLQAEGRLRSETQRSRELVDQVEQLRTELAVAKRMANRLQALLKQANHRAGVNYDAWVQAESQRKELARRLNSMPGPGAMLLTGLIGLGAGVLASSD